MLSQLLVCSAEGVFSMVHRALVLEHLNVPLPAKPPSILTDGKPAPPFYSVVTTPRYGGRCCCRSGPGVVFGGVIMARWWWLSWLLVW